MQETTTLSVREVTSGTDLLALREPWRDLLSRNRPDSPFLTHEWMSSWWEHFGEGRTLAVLVVQDGDRIVGIVPWCVGRTARAFGLFRKLGFLGTGLSDYLGCLLPEPGPVLDAVADALLDRPADWDYLDLREMPNREVADGLASRLAARGLACEILPDSGCLYIPIDSDWPTWRSQRMGKRAGQHMARRRKRMREAGDVQVRVFEEIPADLAPLRAIAAMPQSDTYRGERRESIFSDGAKRAFFEEITRLFSERGWLHLATMTVNGRMAGYHYGFLYGGKYLHYFTGFDPEFAHLSPGRVLMDGILQDCFERGLAEIDFLRGVESWKEPLTDQLRQTVRLVAFQGSIRGRLARQSVLGGRRRAEDPTPRADLPS